MVLLHRQFRYLHQSHPKFESKRWKSVKLLCSNLGYDRPLENDLNLTHKFKSFDWNIFRAFLALKPKCILSQISYLICTKGDNHSLSFELAVNGSIYFCFNGSSVTRLGEILPLWHNLVFFKKMGHSRPLFLYFRLFNTQLTVNKCSFRTKRTKNQQKEAGIGPF